MEKTERRTVAKWIMLVAVLAILAVVVFIFVDLFMMTAPHAQAAETHTTGTINGKALDVSWEMAKDGDVVLTADVPVDDADIQNIEWTQTYISPEGQESSVFSDGMLEKELRFTPEKEGTTTVTVVATTSKGEVTSEIVLDWSKVQGV